MNIVVLNGSPKGLTSVTVQYVRFLQKKLPQHTFAIHNVASELRQLEERPEEFQSLIAAIALADGVLWAFPVYVLLVHAHYKRWIELVEQRGATSVPGQACGGAEHIHSFFRPHGTQLYSRHQR